jgi:hypothetical protein
VLRAVAWHSCLWPPARAGGLSQNGQWLVCQRQGTAMLMYILYYRLRRGNAARRAVLCLYHTVYMYMTNHLAGAPPPLRSKLSRVSSIYRENFRAASSRGGNVSSYRGGRPRNTPGGGGCKPGDEVWQTTDVSSEASSHQDAGGNATMLLLLAPALALGAVEQCMQDAFQVPAVEVVLDAFVTLVMLRSTSVRGIPVHARNTSLAPAARAGGRAEGGRYRRECAHLLSHSRAGTSGLSRPDSAGSHAGSPSWRTRSHRRHHQRATNRANFL